MACNFSEGSGDILRNIFTVRIYIALKLIEYQRLVECWAVYYSEIDRISED